MDETLDLKELVQRAKNYDAEAFGQLYDLYFDKLFGYIYYKIGNRFEAEDIVERVFLKALEKISEFEWRGAPFSSWLFKIASNLVVDYYRSTKYEAVDISKETDLLLGDSCNPEQVAIKESDRSEIVNAMRALTEDQQQVIVMRFIAGMTNEEVAKAIDKNVGAVKALQHRAIGSLGRILRGDLR
ncbi:MAG TPA: sigma-70 family RNA polymerase sigma factor [Anaerolineae bacterium]|jgi:RNA polymerase sigma-70 factor (ECF subfamily)|nr:sigma-70 family RNA polymerase sigma factor [Anaerolineae bacterium]